MKRQSVWRLAVEFDRDSVRKRRIPVIQSGEKKDKQPAGGFAYPANACREELLSAIKLAGAPFLSMD